MKDRMRCYKVQDFNLDEALKTLNEASGECTTFSIFNIFQRKNIYDIVVKIEGYYPYMENEVETKMQELYR